MAKFTTRVELHTNKDYDALHDEMRKKGFTRTIIFDNVEYHLPPAEYNRTGDLKTETVRDDAVSAIKAIGATGEVIVTKADGSRKIYGLKPVRK